MNSSKDTVLLNRKQVEVDIHEISWLIEKAIMFIGVASVSCLFILSASGLVFLVGPQSYFGWEEELLCFYTGLILFGLIGVLVARYWRSRINKNHYVYILVTVICGLVFALTGYSSGIMQGVVAICITLVLAFACTTLLASWAMQFSFRSVNEIRTDISFSIAFGMLVCLAIRDTQWIYVIACLCGLISCACLIVEIMKFDGIVVIEKLTAPSQVQITYKTFIIDIQTGIGIGATTGILALCLESGCVEFGSLLLWTMPSLFCGALLGAILTTVFRERYYIRVKCMHAFLFGTGLLAFIVLPSSCRLGICCYLSAVCALFICLHSISTVEFLRYYSDHPFRIIFLGVMGLCTGSALTMGSFIIAYSVFGAQAVIIITALTVVIQMGLMLIITSFCIYPFDSTFGLEVRTTTDIQHDGKDVKSYRRMAQLGNLKAEYGLTDREYQILELMARGRNASYIADTLVIAPSTTKTHIYHLYAKLGIHTHQELIDLVESTVVSA